jgi:hypothetical protein
MTQPVQIRRFDRRFRRNRNHVQPEPARVGQETMELETMQVWLMPVEQCPKVTGVYFS